MFHYAFLKSYVWLIWLYFSLYTSVTINFKFAGAAVEMLMVALTRLSAQYMVGLAMDGHIL